MAYEAGLVDMAPLVVDDEQQGRAGIEPLDGEMAGAATHRLRACGAVPRVEPVLSARQDCPSLPIVLRAKRAPIPGISSNTGQDRLALGSGGEKEPSRRSQKGVC